MKKFLRTCGALAFAATMTVTSAIAAYASETPAYGTVDGNVWSAEVDIIAIHDGSVSGKAEISLSNVPIITANEDISQEDISQYGQYYGAIHQVPAGTKMEVTMDGGYAFSLRLPEGRRFDEPEFDDPDISMKVPDTSGRLTTYKLAAEEMWDYTFDVPGRYEVSMIATDVIIVVEGESTATQPLTETPVQPTQPVITEAQQTQPVITQLQPAQPIVSGMPTQNAFVPSQSITQYNITWEFTAYDEPNTTSRAVDKFNPQIVNVLRMENGWALINTYQGQKWVNLNNN